MSGPDRDPHDDGWRERMAALGGHAPVGRAAQHQAVDALKRAGYLRPGSSRPRPVHLALLAAAVTLFVVGSWWGKKSSGTGGVAQSLPRFALFLLEDSTFQGTSEVGHDSLVAEYSAWAGELARAGNLVLGEELADGSYPLGEVNGPSTDQLTGLFVIAAANLDAALEIARSCPHLRYGGGMVLRPIAPT